MVKAVNLNKYRGNAANNFFFLTVKHKKIDQYKGFPEYFLLKIIFKKFKKLQFISLIPL